LDDRARLHRLIARPDGNHYCVTEEEVVAFEFATGRCVGSVVRFSRLNGQALICFRNSQPPNRGIPIEAARAVGNAAVRMAN
jgi:hypothetical protein